MSKFRRFLAAKQFTEDHPNDIMMTMDSNPEVMRICYRNGFAKNKAYMTYQEAYAVTDISKFNSAFNNSDIVYFNEAKYFTGIKGNISFIAPKLLEFALPPNISCDINGKFQKCYKYDIGVCVSLSLRNGIETFLNPSISDIVIDPNNKNWGIVEGHLGKGKVLYRKSDNCVGWAVPMYPGDVIIYPKKHQPNQIISVSFTHAMFGGHTIIANNFYSGNVSFWNGGDYVQKIIAFKSTSYYNSGSFPSRIGSKVPQSVVKEFIVSADDPKDFMADTNYTNNFLNPNVCNFQLRRVNFGITIYNEKALFPLKGLYADEYFMTKEECAEVTTLGDRFRNSDLEEFTELQYFTSLENIDNAFYGCSKLKTITLPSHITTIGNNAFANCTSLESIVIPEGVTMIGNNAFANCTSLMSVEIPSTVTYIGDNAFSGCVNISTISMKPTTAPTLGENVWGDNESNYVGSNVNEDRFLIVNNQLVGYDTEKWDILIYKCKFIIGDYLYIQSDGIQYFYLSQFDYSDCEIELKVKYLQLTPDGNAFGAWTGNSRLETGIGWNGNNYSINYGNAGLQILNIIPDTNFHTFKVNKSGVYIDGELVSFSYFHGNASTYGVFNDNLSLRFFGTNRGSTARITPICLSEWKCSRDGEILKHLIPIKTKKGVGMIDVISGNMYYGVNSKGEFKYKLNAIELIINFQIEDDYDNTYLTLKGMTWQEWVYSDYNPIGPDGITKLYYIDATDGIVYRNIFYNNEVDRTVQVVDLTNRVVVLSNDVINPNLHYIAS